MRVLVADPAGRCGHERAVTGGPIRTGKTRIRRVHETAEHEETKCQRGQCPGCDSKGTAQVLRQFAVEFNLRSVGA